MKKSIQRAMISMLILTLVGAGLCFWVYKSGDYENGEQAPEKETSPWAESEMGRETPEEGGGLPEGKDSQTEHQAEEGRTENKTDSMMWEETGEELPEEVSLVFTGVFMTNIIFILFAIDLSHSLYEARKDNNYDIG